MNNILKNSKLTFILGGIIFSTISVYAYSYNAKEINFKSKDANWKANNVEEAINDLYSSNYSYKVIKTYETDQTKDITIPDCDKIFITANYPVSGIGYDYELDENERINAFLNKFGDSVNMDQYIKDNNNRTQTITWTEKNKLNIKRQDSFGAVAIYLMKKINK